MDELTQSRTTPTLSTLPLFYVIDQDIVDDARAAFAVGGGEPAKKKSKKDKKDKKEGLKDKRDKKDKKGKEREKGNADGGEKEKETTPDEKPRGGATDAAAQAGKSAVPRAAAEGGAATLTAQATPPTTAGAAGKGTKAVKYRSAAALARRAEKRRNQGGGPV